MSFEVFERMCAPPPHEAHSQVAGSSSLSHLRVERNFVKLLSTWKLGSKVIGLHRLPMVSYGYPWSPGQKQHIATSIPPLQPRRDARPLATNLDAIKLVFIYHWRKAVPTLWVLSKSVNIPSDCKPTLNFRSWILEFRGSFSVFSNFSTQKRTFLVLFWFYSVVFTIFCSFYWASPARRCEDRGGAETTVPAAASAAWLRWAWRKAKRPKEPAKASVFLLIHGASLVFLRYGFDHEDMEFSYVLQCTSKMPLSAFMASPKR